MNNGDGRATIFGQPAGRAETLADRALFLTDGLVPLACRSCDTEVLVRKNSMAHTSIQWTCPPARHCPVYAATRGSTALMDTCEQLAASIEQAAKAGVFGDIQAEESL